MERCKPARAGGRRQEQAQGQRGASLRGGQDVSFATQPSLVQEVAAENGPARVVEQRDPMGLGEESPAAHHPEGWRGEEFFIPQLHRSRGRCSTSTSKPCRDLSLPASGSPAVPCPRLQPIPPCVERFLSQLLPLLHGNTAAPSLLYGFDACERGRSCFPQRARHRPAGSGGSRGWAGAPEPGSIAPSWGHSREEGCWLGRCWGGGEEHPLSPTQASSSSSLSAGAGHGAFGSPGWFQLWSAWGELGGGGGTGGMCTCFPQHRQLGGGWLWLRGMYPVASPRRGGSSQHPWPEPPRGTRACPRWGGGERGRVGAILGPSFSSYGRGYGTARRLRFLWQRLT